MKNKDLRNLVCKYGGAGYIIVGILLVFRTGWHGHKLRWNLVATWVALCLNICIFVVVINKLLNRQFVSSAPTGYSITDLGTLPSSEHSDAYGINNRGQVVGCSHTNWKSYRAYIWERGTLKELSQESNNTCAFSINEKSQLVGESGQHAVLWQNGKIRVLDGVPERSRASAIDSEGRVVGSYNNDYNAFLWVNGKMKDLGHLPIGLDAYARGINSRGQIVGASGRHAFLWQDGAMQDLGTLIAKGWSQANSINDSSTIVGKAMVATNVWHACRWKGNKIEDLGTLPFDPHSEATAINSKGTIVGYVGLPGYSAQRHAFIYADGKMTDLNIFMSPRNGWILERADGINDSGQIVGTGRYRGEWRAFLLTPKRR